METHVTVVGVLCLVVAVPLLLAGLLLFLGSLVGAGFATAFADVPALGPLIAGAGLIAGLLMAALSLPGLLAGIGLLQQQAWAKIWVYVIAAISLFNIPIGTLFGIYAIWVMNRPQTHALLT